MCAVLYQTSATNPDSPLTAQLDVQLSRADTLMLAKGAEGQGTQPPLVVGIVHITVPTQQRETGAKYLQPPGEEI